MQMKWITYLMVITSTYLVMPNKAWAQEAGPAVEEPAANTFGFTSFWDLTAQAGWFRWFILGVLVIGLFLIIKQFFELWDDGRRGSKLQSLNFENMSIDGLEQRISNESNHMLSRMLSTLLNVYKSSGVAIMLHEEVANFIQMEQERFSTFKQRVDFLSDSAGAFGLLGTVWGIFLVFSQRDLDPQNILGGMGLALITTLLGLVVSIILNLCSTEVSNLFTRRLDIISAKADEARFRLMKDSGTSSQAIANEWAKRQAVMNDGAGAYATQHVAYQRDGRNNHNSSRREQARSAYTQTAVKERPPAKLARLGNNQSAPAGQLLPGQIGVQIFDDEDIVMAGIKVQFAVQTGNGKFEGNTKNMLCETDESGIASVQFYLDSEPGFNRIAAKVDGIEKKLEFQAMGLES